MKPILLLSISMSACFAQISITTTPAPVPPMIVFQPYTLSLTATGGTPPYTWTVTAGDFPPGDPAPGFELDPVTCVSSSVPCQIISSSGSGPGFPVGCHAYSLIGNNFNQCGTATFPQAAIEPMQSALTVQAADSLSVTATKSIQFNMYWDPPELIPVKDEYGVTWTPFVATQAANFQAMMAQIGGNTIPNIKIVASGQLRIADAKFRSVSLEGPSANSAKWHAWSRAIKAAGGGLVWLYVDVECYVNVRPSCIAEYANEVAYAHSLGMAVGLSPGMNNLKPCGDLNCPATQATGEPSVPSNGLLTACSQQIGHTINANVITVGGNSYQSGVADWMACLTTPIIAKTLGAGCATQNCNALNYSGTASCSNCSVYQYLLVGMGLQAGDILMGPHEPYTQTQLWGGGILTSGCSTTPPTTEPHPIRLNCNGQGTSSGPVVPVGNSCPQDWLVNFSAPWLTYISTTNAALVPAGLILGHSVAWNEEMQTPTVPVSPGIDTLCSGLTMAQCFANNTPASVHIGLDLYGWSPNLTSCGGTTCTITNGNYPWTVAWIQSHSLSGGSTGHPVFTQEGLMQDFVAPGAPSTGACAIIGNQSCTLQAEQLNFLPAMYTYLAGLGLESANIFSPNVYTACSTGWPDSVEVGTVLQNATTAMIAGQQNILGARLAEVIGQWATSKSSGGGPTGGSVTK